MNVRLIRLLASHALSAVAMAMPWPVLLALTWEADPSLAGWVGAARMAPYVALSWLVGGLGDRWGRLRVLRGSTLLRVPALLVTALAVVADQPLLAAVAATLAVALGTPAFPSLAGLLPAAGGELDRATGWLVTAEVSAFVVGPAVGGLLLGWVGPEVAAGVPVLLAAAGGLLLLGLRVAVGSPAETDSTRLIDGLRLIVRKPQVVGAIATIMAVNAVLGAIGVALLAITEQSWFAGAAEFGYATAALGFGALLTPLAVRLIRGRGRPAQVAVVATAVPLLALLVSPTWQVALVPLLLLGVGSTLVECETTRVLQNAAPERYRSLALALADTAMIGAALVGAASAPWLVATIGSGPLLFGLALGSALSCWFGLRRGRAVADQGPLPPVAQPLVEGDRPAPMLLDGEVHVPLS